MKPAFLRPWRALVTVLALPALTSLGACDSQVPIGNESTDAPTVRLDADVSLPGTGGLSGTGGTLAGSPGTGGAAVLGGTTGAGGATATGVPDAATLSNDTADSPILGGSGGNVGTGGAIAVGTGGAIDAGAGGTTGSGGGSGCVTHSARLSSQILTVGIVTWSSTVPGVKSAKIDFGLDTSYGMTAPVDKPASGDNTTWLLGMKQAKTYHYRITVTGTDGDCVGPDATLQTGTLTGVPKLTVETLNTNGLYGGFLVTGQYVSTGGAGIPAYIVDADGDIVWAFKFPKDVTGAVMSYDGKWMWVNSANVPESQVVVQRLAMDGEVTEDKSSSFAGMNHQLTVLPDETVAFYSYNASKKCEDIKEYAPSTGNVRTIVNAADAQGGATSCHLDNIQYSPWDDTLVFSDLDNQVVVKVKRSDGKTVWVLNGAHATYTGDTWKGGQSGIHLLAQDRLLLFNNNSRSGTASGGDGTGSIVLELKLDDVAKKVTTVWTYKSDVQNDVLGDVQRLDNGNTVIAYSTQGVVQEVDKSGAILQEWTLPIGASMGYIQKRKTLYGAPPR